MLVLTQVTKLKVPLEELVQNRGYDVDCYVVMMKAVDEYLFEILLYLYINRCFRTRF